MATAITGWSLTASLPMATENRVVSAAHRHRVVEQRPQHIDPIRAGSLAGGFHLLGTVPVGKLSRWRRRHRADMGGLQRCQRAVQPVGDFGRATSASTNPARKAAGGGVAVRTGHFAGDGFDDARSGEADDVAPSTAQRRSARLPSVTHTPPVVGWSATAMWGMPASASRWMPIVARAMPTSPPTPSCNRVPPLRSNEISGRRARIEASTAASSAPGVELAEAAAEDVEIPADDDHCARADACPAPPHGAPRHVIGPVHAVDRPVVRFGRPASRSKGAPRANPPPSGACCTSPVAADESQCRLCCLL